MSDQKKKGIKKALPYFGGITLICAGLFLGYSYLQYKETDRRYQSTIATLAATTGQLVALSLEMQSDEAFSGKSFVQKLKGTIRLQSLALRLSDLDVTKLDAESFKGICVIVANVNNIFPVVRDNSVEAKIDNLLNSQLNVLRGALTTESTIRSLRIGDHHKCPGIKKE